MLSDDASQEKAPSIPIAPPVPAPIPVVIKQEPVLLEGNAYSAEYSESTYWKVDNSIPLDANDILNY